MLALKSGLENTVLVFFVVPVIFCCVGDFVLDYSVGAFGSVMVISSEMEPFSLTSAKRESNSVKGTRMEAKLTALSDFSISLTK